jgi:hypothetical protein
MNAQTAPRTSIPVFTGNVEDENFKYSDLAGVKRGLGIALLDLPLYLTAPSVSDRLSAAARSPRCHTRFLVFRGPRLGLFMVIVFTSISKADLTANSL